MSEKTSSPTPVATKSEERRVFILLAVFLAPFLSILLVGGYGFLVWMSHLLLGPPTH